MFAADCILQPLIISKCCLYINAFYIFQIISVSSFVFISYLGFLREDDHHCVSFCGLLGECRSCGPDSAAKDRPICLL